MIVDIVTPKLRAYVAGRTQPYSAAVLIKWFVTFDTSDLLVAWRLIGKFRLCPRTKLARLTDDAKKHDDIRLNFIVHLLWHDALQLLFCKSMMNIYSGQPPPFLGLPKFCRIFLVRTNNMTSWCLLTAALCQWFDIWLLNAGSCSIDAGSSVRQTVTCWLLLCAFRRSIKSKDTHPIYVLAIGVQVTIACPYELPATWVAC